jgi:hypothetical protein
LNKLYLNPDLLVYYKSALLEELELGNIDVDISTHLIKICDSNLIRPIFSKKGKNSINNKVLESYLRIAFTKEFYSKYLKEIVNNLNKKCNTQNKLRFSIIFIKPTIQEKRERNEYNKSSKWLVDPNYFNISQIEFRLKNGDQELHDEFWKDLTYILLIR